MLNDEQWADLKAQSPAWIERLRRDLGDLARGRCGWAEVLQIGDAELLGMARLGAGKLESGRAAEAERIFWVLTQLDPFVAWFWMALGDAQAKLGKLERAIEAYGRCLQEAGRMQPPSRDEMRVASLRRGRLLVQVGRPEEAFEDLKRTVELDTAAVPDGERAWVAIQDLAARQLVPQALLLDVPRPR